MPRQAREKSEKGIYHIILRGINRQQIFEDEEDYLKFLDTIEKYKTKSGYKLLAYCLMGNHIHLLIMMGKESLEQIFKRIGSSYVYWYNWKYERVGHLFQDRFKSEPVDDEDYLFTVLRYIHQNPLKAGLCKSIEKYAYSSYREYLEARNTYTDTGFILGMINKEQFVKLHMDESAVVCMDIHDSNFRLTDKEAGKILKKVSNCDNPTNFQALDVHLRDKYIRELKEKGLSIRQICRLTGISFGIVRRI